jgi:hypothetical protein
MSDEQFALGDQLNEDILRIIESLMCTTDEREEAILEALVIAVERYEKVRYPMFTEEEK